MAKSPFAPIETETYAYPAPWAKDIVVTDPATGNQRSPIDPEVMAETVEERPWVKFRIPRAKNDVDAIADYTQTIVVGDNGDGTALEFRISRANRGVFALLCEGWSFTERDPTQDDFMRLDRWAAEWIMACMNDAMGKGQAADFPPPTPSSSKRPKGSRAASASVRNPGS